MLASLVMSALALRTAAATNFIVVLCDDLGYGDVSCYGNKEDKTPHVDRLAKAGVRCTDFYAAPACTPTRSSLLTG